MKKFLFIGFFLLAAGMAVAHTQLMLFVIPPIEPIPHGTTLVMLRPDNMDFMESPYSLCTRVNLSFDILCESVVTLAALNKGRVLFELPYSSWLYGQSIRGKAFSPPQR